MGLEKIDLSARTQTTTDWVSGYPFTGGVSIGFTQKLIGSLGYRWTYGEKGHFALGNVPAKIDIGANRLVLGLDYHLF
jgi:opacity protein-like surface antigen